MEGSDPTATSRALISWRDVALAVDELIATAQRSIDVFDQSLELQGWETRARSDALKAAMIERNVQVRMLVIAPGWVTTSLPRLMTLLKSHGHQLQIVAPGSSVNPNPNFIVADQQHLLFRPNSVRSPGTLHFNNSYKSMTYSKSFEVLWQQRGTQVFPEAFGL